MKDCVLIYKCEPEEGFWEWCRLWKPHSQPPETQLLKQGHTSYTFPNASTWEQSIQPEVSTGTIHSQPEASILLFI